MDNYLNQITPLAKINGLLDRNGFGIDECEMIDEYLPETGLKLNFVYDCLKEYRKASMSKAGLKDKVYTLRTDLHRHIDKRIYLLRHVSEIDPDKSLVFDPSYAPKIGRDPWLVNIHQKGVDKEALLAASLHVRDILFAAGEFEKAISEKTQKFLIEFRKFNKALPSYLSLSKNLHASEAEAIKKKFDKLYQLVEKNQLDEIKKCLSEIRHFLRHSGEKSLPNTSGSTNTSKTKHHDTSKTIESLQNFGVEKVDPQ